MTTDLRVLEVSDGVAAQMAGFMFAELGARVTKLSFTGETSRSPQLEFALDRGKDGLESGRSEAAGRLVEMSADHDVVILGSDWMDLLAGEHVRERLPRVVWLVLAGSESGSHPADGMLAEAASGLMSRQQGRREGPYCVTEPMAAYGAGLIGTAAALAALLKRLDTGIGDVVETSYLEGAVAVQAMSACFTLESGPEPVRYHDPYCVSMTPAIRFHQAADGWVLIGTVTAVQWQRLLTMVGKQALLGDERLDGAPLIMRDQAIGEEIAGAISAFVGQQNVQRVSATLRGRGNRRGTGPRPRAVPETPAVRGERSSGETEGGGRDRENRARAGHALRLAGGRDTGTPARRKANRHRRGAARGDHSRGHRQLRRDADVRKDSR